jgi:hypothetical protein
VYAFCIQRDGVKTKPAAAATPENMSVPLRMPRRLKARVSEASQKTGLAEQDVMRLSLDRGLDVLLAQLTTPPSSPRTVMEGAAAA